MDQNSHSILFLSKYSRSGASSRYRTYQYVPNFEQNDVHCEVSPLFDDNYLHGLYQYGKADLLSAVGGFFRRLRALFCARHFDLVVLEYELLPYFPDWLERVLVWIGVPYVVDYDDALFHQYDKHHSGLVRKFLGNKITSVMRHAELVTTGNEYLADYAIRAGAKRVEIIPTVVDLGHYPLPIKDNGDKDNFIIGWIGSPSTSKYLKMIAPELAEVCKDNGGLVRLIGSGDIDLPGVPVEALPWSEDAEVARIQSFDVGIMPLPDEPWARGKCGFKLIQYMACGLPVVASPVGVNAEIVEENSNGFLARDHKAWVEALCALRDDPEMRKRLGTAGRKKVEAQYCLQVTAPRLVELLKSVIEKP